jgi:hypothetical protein
VSKQKVTVLFFNSYGDQVGCDDIPYPPSAVYVQLGVGKAPDAPHGILRAASGVKLAPDEVRQFEEAFAQVIPHLVEPAGMGIVFGADSREVLPGERPLHPLTSQCRCGRQITKLTSDGEWAHSD